METAHTINSNNKLAIGWFSFTCSEDSTILFTELLNDHFDEWKDLVEFRHVKALKTKNELRDLDVSFVEGAISSDEQAKEAHEIRENSKYIVAVGACACTGKPSSSRNEVMTEDMTEKMKFYMSHFDYSDEVKKLGDVIKVDDMVPGCPMNAETFLKVLQKYLKLFEIV